MFVTSCDYHTTGSLGFAELQDFELNDYLGSSLEDFDRVLANEKKSFSKTDRKTKQIVFHYISELLIDSGVTDYNAGDIVKLFLKNMFDFVPVHFYKIKKRGNGRYLKILFHDREYFPEGKKIQEIYKRDLHWTVNEETGKLQYCNSNYPGKVKTILKGTLKSNSEKVIYFSEIKSSVMRQPLFSLKLDIIKSAFKEAEVSILGIKYDVHLRIPQKKVQGWMNFWTRKKILIYNTYVKKINVKLLEIQSALYDTKSYNEFKERLYSIYYRILNFFKKRVYKITVDELNKQTNQVEQLIKKQRWGLKMSQNIFYQLFEEKSNGYYATLLKFQKEIHKGLLWV